MALSQIIIISEGKEFCILYLYRMELNQWVTRVTHRVDLCRRKQCSNSRKRFVTGEDKGDSEVSHREPLPAVREIIFLI